MNYLNFYFVTKDKGMNRIIIWLFVLMVGVVASGHAQSLKRKGVAAPMGFDYYPETIKILSWNVEHFVDELDNPYVNNDRENSPAEHMADKETLLAKAIQKANADIVVLQEFESSEYLRAIAQKHFPEMGYLFFAGNESDGWYMNVVVMSKVPLGTLYSYGSLYTPVPGIMNEEGIEETQINLNTRMLSIDVFPNAEYAFNLTAVHLKAGRGERNEQMRIGQIDFLKNQFARFLKEDKKANLVVMGDFNSLVGSKEIERLLSGKRGSKFIDPLDESIMTHPSREPSRRLDYMIPNTNMLEELIAGTMKVEYLLPKEEMVRLSDHLPVIGKFRVVKK